MLSFYLKITKITNKLTSKNIMLYVIIRNSSNTTTLNLFHWRECP